MKKNLPGKPDAIKLNGIAVALLNPCFRTRKVKPKAGRGSYRRKGRNEGGPTGSSPAGYSSWPRATGAAA